jgi:prepilin-type N-terminal cleavage/methylation domain-containing protein
MKSIQPRTKFIPSDRGFTIVELLVASALSSLIMMMTIGHVLIIRNGYFDDVVRTQINSNLRSAMDILSMNIRQAGENLQASFPAVQITDGADGLPDTLILRRNLVQEVLTVCTAIHAGDTTLHVSSSSVTNPECLAANVGTLHSVFENYRTSNNNSVRAYIFNRITGHGEFVDYTGGGASGGEYYINVSALSAAYDALTTNIYLIEEYNFSQNSSENTLDLVINGKDDESQTVAFSVTDFQAYAKMSDGTELTSFDFSSSKNWRDISQVHVTLSGEERTKDRVMKSSIQAEYFPRNVLSH